MSLRVIPLDLSEANAVVLKYHRHHKPAVGHRFSVGVINESGEVVGAAIASRPIARLADQKFTLEVTRVATDGTRNACSILLGAVAKAARSLGYSQVQTTTLKSESGSSLKAVGWRVAGESDSSLGWNSRAGRNVDCQDEGKVKWVLDISAPPSVLAGLEKLSRRSSKEHHTPLFD